MTGSANEAVPAVEAKDVEPVGPKQLREFDAKLLQQLPDLAKNQMQHLIEHPEELRARLRYFGLHDMESHFPTSFCFIDRNKRATWGDFYADVFGVGPDFSRLRLPDSSVFTYTTPIFVAPRLDLKQILDAFAQYEVELVGRELFARGVRDIERPRENYIASFSTMIIEDVPELVKDEARYRATRMTLREYLLWILYALYRHRKDCSVDSDLDKINGRTQYGVEQFFPGTVFPETEGEVSPNLELRRKNEKTRMRFGKRNLFEVLGEKVRRVKLFRSLPQI